MQTVEALLFGDDSNVGLHKFILSKIIHIDPKTRGHCNFTHIVLVWVGGEADWLDLAAVEDGGGEGEHGHVVPQEVPLQVRGVDGQPRHPGRGPRREVRVVIIVCAEQNTEMLSRRLITGVEAVIFRVVDAVSGGDDVRGVYEGAGALPARAPGQPPLHVHYPGVLVLPHLLAPRYAVVLWCEALGLSTVTNLIIWPTCLSIFESFLLSLMFGPPNILISSDCYWEQSENIRIYLPKWGNAAPVPIFHQGLVA